MAREPVGEAEVFATSRGSGVAREPFEDGGFHGVLAIGAVVLGGAVVCLIAMYLGRAPVGSAIGASSGASASASAAGLPSGVGRLPQTR
jgi:hypothetical protein